ncbi:hypothetical protein NPIL_40861 [Nephila pilipes]|uniref:Uncharacterized protein n=1 Tax=Nephila pilipes TaxID=299642 RepID=A0A8X6QJS7_NEPPI|nr:hypothetical protein NPIL_40861 [Nephila pilipes]
MKNDRLRLHNIRHQPHQSERKEKKGKLVFLPVHFPITHYLHGIAPRGRNFSQVALSPPVCGGGRFGQPSRSVRSTCHVIDHLTIFPGNSLHNADVFLLLVRRSWGATDTTLRLLLFGTSSGEFFLSFLSRFPPLTLGGISQDLSIRVFGLDACCALRRTKWLHCDDDYTATCHTSDDFFEE